MTDAYTRLLDSVRHVEVLHRIFRDAENFGPEDQVDRLLYAENDQRLSQSLQALSLHSQLYGEAGRQMILADVIEYIFLGRGYLAAKTKQDRSNFIKAILHFANLLMCYEAMTVSRNLRRRFLDLLGNQIPAVDGENLNAELKNLEGTVGLKRDEVDAPEHLNRYFDTLLPKTAGGLWHELLVYIFLLRNNCGYIIPLVLSQRLLGFENHIIPPDFLVIAKDKRIYGVEVGTKKEIQSGSFSLKTAIPTATVDTEKSRNSDRCPICKKWIQLCPFVIEHYSNLDEQIRKIEVRCLAECTLYQREEISAGRCAYTKYRRNRANTLQHTLHNYSNNLHYHYACVLNAVDGATRERIINAQDTVALKTHFPYYSGLEDLMKQTSPEEAQPDNA